MLRVILAISLIAVVPFMSGCDVLGSGSGAVTREGERIVADSADDAPIEVTVDNLLGQWQTPGPLEGDLPTRRVLSLAAGGVGAAWTFIDFEGPGMGAPTPFNYTLEDSRVVLRFEDGRSEAFIVKSLKPNLMVSSVDGTATWAATGTWTQHAE